MWLYHRVMLLEQSDLDLHCLPRHICPKTLGSLQYIIALFIIGLCGAVKPNKVTCVSANMPKQFKVVGRKIYLFLSSLYLLEKDQKCLLGLNFINSTRKLTNNEV